jgi:hypothetical protein
MQQSTNHALWNTIIIERQKNTSRAARHYIEQQIRSKLKSLPELPYFIHGYVMILLMQQRLQYNLQIDRHLIKPFVLLKGISGSGKRAFASIIIQYIMNHLMWKVQSDYIVIIINKNASIPAWNFHIQARGLTLPRIYVRGAIRASIQFVDISDIGYLSSKERVAPTLCVIDPCVSILHIEEVLETSYKKSWGMSNNTSILCLYRQGGPPIRCFDTYPSTLYSPPLSELCDSTNNKYSIKKSIHTVHVTSGSVMNTINQTSKIPSLIGWTTIHFSHMLSVSSTGIYKPHGNSIEDLSYRSALDSLTIIPWGLYKHQDYMPWIDYRMDPQPLICRDISLIPHSIKDELEKPTQSIPCDICFNHILTTGGRMWAIRCCYHIMCTECIIILSEQKDNIFCPYCRHKWSNPLRNPPYIPFYVLQTFVQCLGNHDIMLKQFQCSIGNIVKPLLQSLGYVSHIYEPKCHSLLPILYAILSSPQNDWMILSSSQFIENIMFIMWKSMSPSARRPISLMNSKSIEIYNSTPLIFIPIYISSCVYRPRFEHVLNVAVFGHDIASYIIHMCPNLKRVIRITWDISNKDHKCVS